MLVVERSSKVDQRQQGRRAREQVDALYRFWHTRQVASAFAAIIRRLGASAWRGLSRPLGKFISVQPAKAPTFRYSSTPDQVIRIFVKEATVRYSRVLYLYHLEYRCTINGIHKLTCVYVAITIYIHIKKFIYQL